MSNLSMEMDDEPLSIFSGEFTPSIDNIEFYDPENFEKTEIEMTRLKCPVSVFEDGQKGEISGSNFDRILVLEKKSNRSNRSDSLRLAIKKRDPTQKRLLAAASLNAPRFVIEIFDGVTLNRCVGTYPFCDILSFDANLAKKMVTITAINGEEVFIKFLRLRDAKSLFFQLGKYMEIVSPPSPKEKETSDKRKGVGTNRAVQSTFSMKKKTGIFSNVPVEKWKLKQLQAWSKLCFVRVSDIKSKEEEQVLTLRQCLEGLHLMKPLSKYMEHPNANLFTLRDELVKYEKKQRKKKKRKQPVAKGEERYIQPYNPKERRVKMSFDPELFRLSFRNVNSNIFEVFGLEIPTSSDLLRTTMNRLVFNINTLECLEVYPHCFFLYSRPFYLQYLKILECRKDFSESFHMKRRYLHQEEEEEDGEEDDDDDEDRYVDKNLLHYLLQNGWVRRVEQNTKVSYADKMLIAERYLLYQPYFWDAEEMKLALKQMLYFGGKSLYSDETMERKLETVFLNNFFYWAQDKIVEIRNLQNDNDEDEEEEEGNSDRFNEIFDNKLNCTPKEFDELVREYCGDDEPEEEEEGEEEEVLMTPITRIIEQEKEEEGEDEEEDDGLFLDVKYDLKNLSWRFRRTIIRWEIIKMIQTICIDIKRIEDKIRRIEEENKLSEISETLTELKKAEHVMKHEMKKFKNEGDDNTSNLEDEIRQIQNEKEKMSQQYKIFKTQIDVLKGEIERKEKTDLKEAKKLYSIYNQKKMEFAPLYHNWRFLRSSGRRKAISKLLNQKRKILKKLPFYEDEDEVLVRIRLEYMKGHSYYISFDLGQFIRVIWIDGGFVMFLNEHRCVGKKEDEEEEFILEPIWSSTLEVGIFKNVKKNNEHNMDAVLERLGNLLVRYGSEYHFKILGEMDDDKNKKNKKNNKKKNKKKKKKKKKKLSKKEKKMIPPWKNKTEKELKSPFDFYRDVMNVLKCTPLHETFSNNIKELEIVPTSTSTRNNNILDSITKGIRVLSLKDQMKFRKRYRKDVLSKLNQHNNKILASQTRIIFNTHKQLDDFVNLLKKDDEQYSGQENYLEVMHNDIYQFLKGLDDAFWELHKRKKGKYEEAKPHDCPFRIDVV